MTTVIVSGARTPIGKLLGALGTQSAVDLGAVAIRAAVDRAGIDPSSVDAVQFGNVVQAGVGPNPARLSALGAGLPMSAHATSINKLCLSGLAAIGAAHLGIGAGLSSIAVAGGTESMTNAPHLSHLRSAVKYGPAEFADALERDALICGIEHELMGAATDRHQGGMGIAREEQDELAAASHQRAAASAALLAEEIVPVTISSRRGDTVVATDEGVRPDTTAESLAALRPAFRPDGTITAGSSSQLSDGAAALVLMDRDRAEALRLPWLAEIVSYGTVAGPDPSLLLQPANAVRRALALAELEVGDLDLFELNEAFASVVVASRRDLGLPADVVNVNGGAIALGHPVGMSGARLALTLALELRRRGGGLGAAALCGGGGQGDALILRVPAA